MTPERFEQCLSQQCRLAPGSRVLIALSGGADSVALLMLFLSVMDSYPLSVFCAHVEHGIRGDEAQEDLAFAGALCREKNIPFYAAHVDAPAYARERGCGLEEAARTLRYAFLEKTADEIGADVIALAHHAGDQRETVLLHAMRGSDIRGLCAMRFRRGRLIRPLLEQEPQALRDMLEAMEQPWREDGTNTDERYTRNRIRRTLLPQMEETVPGAGAAMERLARAAQRDEDYFSALLKPLEVIALADGAAMERTALASLHPAVLSRAIVRLTDRAGIAPQSARTIDSIMAALSSGEAAVNLTDGAHAVVGKRYLCMIRAQAQTPETPLRVPGVTDTPFGRFEVRAALSGETGDGKRTQAVPVRLLLGAVIGGRQTGDVMVPFGMHSPVRIKKLMIDAGVERALRNSVPLLRQDKTVLFVPGLRASQWVRCAPEEERMLVVFKGRLFGRDGEQSDQEGESNV